MNHSQKQTVGQTGAHTVVQAGETQNTKKRSQQHEFTSNMNIEGKQVNHWSELENRSESGISEITEADTSR